MGSLKKVGGRDLSPVANSVERIEAGGVGGSSGDFEKATSATSQSGGALGLTVMSERSLICFIASAERSLDSLL